MGIGRYIAAGTGLGIAPALFYAGQRYRQGQGLLNRKAELEQNWKKDVLKTLGSFAAGAAAGGLGAYGYGKYKHGLGVHRQGSIADKFRTTFSDDGMAGVKMSSDRRRDLLTRVLVDEVVDKHAGGWGKALGVTAGLGGGIYGGRRLKQYIDQKYTPQITQGQQMLGIIDKVRQYAPALAATAGTAFGGTFGYMAGKRAGQRQFDNAADTVGRRMGPPPLMLRKGSGIGNENYGRNINPNGMGRTRIIFQG